MGSREREREREREKKVGDGGVKGQRAREAGCWPERKERKV